MTRFQFDNAYIFFMSDHGMHVGDMPHTTIGQIEIRNPFLYMTIPKSLRDDEHTQTMLRKNTKELITHYDLYATFIDILQSANASIPAPNVMKGTSIFKPLPQPRTCDRLGVPFDYCICDFEKTPLPNNAEPSRIAAEKMVKRINAVIKQEAMLAEKCEELALNENRTIQVQRFSKDGDITIYQLTFAVLPGDGMFLGYAGAKHNGSDVFILSDKFVRLGTYAKTAYCATKSSFAQFCHCKKQMKEDAESSREQKLIENLTNATIIVS
uniref:Sulfatase domain-containing protein n=1 Tax=Panagrellus redivivus TaxID=6233 RepID=A0A7E4ZWS8_PANRE